MIYEFIFVILQKQSKLLARSVPSAMNLKSGTENILRAGLSHTLGGEFNDAVCFLLFTFPGLFKDGIARKVVKFLRLVKQPYSYIIN